MSYAGSFQMWLGVAILIGLLFILVESEEQCREGGCRTHGS